VVSKPEGKPLCRRCPGCRSSVTLERFCGGIGTKHWRFSSKVREGSLPKHARTKLFIFLMSENLKTWVFPFFFRTPTGRYLSRLPSDFFEELAGFLSCRHLVFCYYFLRQVTMAGAAPPFPVPLPAFFARPAAPAGPVPTPTEVEDAVDETRKLKKLKSNHFFFICPYLQPKPTITAASNGAIVTRAEIGTARTYEHAVVSIDIYQSIFVSIDF